jgi:hypothetical protein
MRNATRVSGNSLLDILPPSDRQRAGETINDLCAGITGRFMLVGGLPIRFWLHLTGGEVPDRPFNDLDLIADGPQSFNPVLNEEFLVHHFHRSQPGIDFRFVLVHRATVTKVDVFHWKPHNYGCVNVRFGGERLPLQNLSTQFAVTVYDLEMMRRRGPVDPKQLDDALAMEPHVIWPQAEASWYSLFADSPPTSLAHALTAAIERSGTPAEFAAKPWQSHDTNYRCAKCVVSESDDWPLAPMLLVHDLLGYIELDGKNLA